MLSDVHRIACSSLSLRPVRLSACQCVFCVCPDSSNHLSSRRALHYSCRILPYTAHNTTHNTHEQTYTHSNTQSHHTHHTHTHITHTGAGGVGSATKSREDSDGKDDEEKTKMRGDTMTTHLLQYHHPSLSSSVFCLHFFFILSSFCACFDLSFHFKMKSRYDC
jgi:hypothetical protein